jgi:transposase
MGRQRASGYSHRAPVERGFLRFKHFRRVATRYDRSAASFLALATLAATMVLLR